MKKAIVLGADNGYLYKLETTIKSVCTHNKNVKFLIKFTLTFFDFCIKIKLKLKILIRGENE